MSEFIASATVALTPGKVYDDPFAKFYQLLKNYKSGHKDYDAMNYMIKKGIEAREYADVEVLIRDYYDWLLTQPKEKNIYSG